MESGGSHRNLGLLLIIAGVAVVVGAALFFTIDADPAWLFGDPFLSTIVALLGFGLAFLGWKKTRANAEQ